MLVNLSVVSPLCALILRMFCLEASGDVTEDIKITAEFDVTQPKN